MHQFPETRRRFDGSIDFDFYRAQALAARGEMLRNAFKLKAAFGFTFITLTLIVCVTIAASSPTHWASRLIAFSMSAVSAGGQSVH